MISLYLSKLGGNTILNLNKNIDDHYLNLNKNGKYIL